MTTEIDWDRAYNNRDFIPDADGFIARWAAAAAAFRDTARAELDIPHGPHPREAFDLFLPAGAPEGVVVFVHGGYWKAFSRKDWSHFASGALARGWAVAMPSYPLCPEVTLPEITASVRAAIIAAAARVPGEIRLVGHSAGGHLVARMLNADAGLPGDLADRIAAVVPISPVGDLRPLMRTGMRDVLHLTDAVALAESPALQPARTGGVEITVWVGADERPVFLKQARDLAQAWDVAILAEDGRHHFDVIDGLRDPYGPMIESVLF